MEPKHIVIDARIRRSTTGRYVDRLLEHLQTMHSDYRFTVLVSPDDTWQPFAKNFRRVDCKYPQFSLNPLHQIGFPRFLNKLKADIVHFPLNNQPVLYFGKTVVSTLDLTMLYFTRAGKTPLPIFWVKMAAFRFLFWYSNKKSVAVITISDYVKNALTKKYPFVGRKITRTYNASEPPLPVPAVKPHNINEPFIFYVGTAFPHKNLENLIKAFEILNTSQPELNLVLVGKKEQYYERLEKLAGSSPARSSITFTGFIPDEELKWLYEHAETYVFPSLSEGFGLPGLEAMVHGCPVVSSNATCLPEVYGDAAHYFDPNNIEDMAAKIKEVLDTPTLREELIKKGHLQTQKYSWHHMAEQTLEIYTQALGK